MSATASAQSGADELRTVVHLGAIDTLPASLLTSTLETIASTHTTDEGAVTVAAATEDVRTITLTTEARLLSLERDFDALTYMFGTEEDAPNSDHYASFEVLADADECGNSIFDVLTGSIARRADSGW